MTTRYFIRIQLIEQTGFDDDTPGITVQRSDIVTVPTLQQYIANSAYIDIKSVIGLMNGFKGGKA